MNYIFEFICMAIPKAGIIFKELPFNLSTVMLPLIALFNYKEIIRFMSKRKFFFYYIIFTKTLNTNYLFHNISS